MIQSIWGRIQRHFGLSCVYQVYFLRKSKEFCDIQTECQIINNPHSVITVLHIYHKFTVIAWLIAPWSLPDYSHISPQSILGMMKLCCITSFLTQRLNTWNLLQRNTYLLCLFIFSEWNFNNIDHWRSINMVLNPQPTKRSASSADSREASSTTYHLTKSKRSKLPLSFGYTLFRRSARSSLWKPSPSVSIKSTNFYNRRTSAFPLSILSNTPATALARSE